MKFANKNYIKTISFKDFVPLVLISTLFILNDTPTSNVIIFLLLLMQVIISFRSITWNFLFLKIPLLFVIIISLIINVNANINTTENVRLITITALFLFFPLKINPSNKCFFYILSGIGLYIIIMQIGTAFGISSFINFLNSYYPINKNFWAVGSIKSIHQITGEGMFKRFAGIYYNPNIMGQFSVLWFVLIINLLNLSNFSIKIKNQLTFFLIFIASFSIVISGSRTALAVLMFFLVWHYYHVLKNKFYLFIMPVIMLLIYFYDIFIQLRIFSFATGVTSSTGSLNIKYELLKNWLNSRFSGNTAFIHVLFGNLKWDDMLDADPGYILSYFGLFGGLSILWFFIFLFITYPKENRSNLSLLLIGLGATIIMNFRFSILAFIIFSIPFTNQVINVKDQSFKKN